MPSVLSDPFEFRLFHVRIHLIPLSSSLLPNAFRPFKITSSPPRLLCILRDLWVEPLLFPCLCRLLISPLLCASVLNLFSSSVFL